MSAFFAIVLSLLAIFLILLVLVQRGRGGGLAGALGGMGGSSAFGAKAGDVFTRITIVTAGIWIVVCVAAFYWASHRSDVLSSNAPANAESPLDAGPLGGGGGNDLGAPLPTVPGGGDATAPQPSSTPPATVPATTEPPSTAPSSTAPAEGAPAENE